MLIGLPGFALLDAVTAISPWYPLTFAARLLAGVMGGALWSMLAGYAARMVPAAQRGRAVAVVLGGITVALCARIPAGTALAGALGWRASFGLLAGLALLLTAWIRWQVPAFGGEPAAGASRCAGSRGSRASARSSPSPCCCSPGTRRCTPTSLPSPRPHQSRPAGLRRRDRGRDLDHRNRRRPVPAARAADRHGLIATAMLVLGLAGASRAALLAAAGLWGAAFGGGRRCCRPR